MDLNGAVYRMNNDKNDCLTFLVPAGITRQQIKDYVIGISKIVLVAESPNFDHIRILGGLLHKIEHAVFFGVVSDKPLVFVVTLCGESTDTRYTDLPEDRGPVEICHKWGNYPAFDLIENLLKE